MQQLALLWDYQQIDMKLDRQEAEMRKLPIRQKLLKCRNTLVDGQKTLEKLDAQMEDKEKHFHWIKGQYRQASDIIARRRYEMETETDFIAQDFVIMRSDAEKLSEVLEKLENELRTLIQQMEAQGKAITDLLSRMTRAKKEYPALREQYDQAQEQYALEMGELQAQMEKAAGGIDEPVIKRYKSVKKNRTPPVARITSNQCSGCNMELAAVTVRNARQGDKLIECENCGRILYFVDQE